MNQIDMLLEPIRVFLRQLGDLLPRLALALVVLIAGWLVAIVPLAASAITIGPHSEMPQSRPPSRSQSAWASLKYCAASA